MAQFSESMDVPDMGRRQFMNLLTFGTVTGVAAGVLYPVVNYFIPPLAVVLVVVQSQRMNWAMMLVSASSFLVIMWEIGL